MTPMLTPSHDLSALIQDPPGPPLLLRRMQQLPRRTQQMLLYSRLDALPYPTIAQRMNTSLGQVETTLQTALRLLRATVAGADHGHPLVRQTAEPEHYRERTHRFSPLAGQCQRAFGSVSCHRTAMAAITCPCHRAGQ